MGQPSAPQQSSKRNEQYLSKVRQKQEGTEVKHLRKWKKDKPVDQKIIEELRDLGWARRGW